MSSVAIRVPEGYVIRELESEEFWKHWDLHAPGIFDEKSLIFRWREHGGAEELERSRKLERGLTGALRINLGIFHGDAFVGWSWGIQQPGETFYMVNSAVLPEHRGKGLYRALMESMVVRASDLGFQLITSRHVACNNAILVPKLKAGFQITGFEVSDSFGVLVTLTYYTSELRRKVYTYRTGQERPDAEVKKVLSLS